MNIIQLKKIFAFICIFLSVSLQAGNHEAHTGEPKAVINYNAEKSGTTEIIYDTSFMIIGLTMNDADKQVLVKEIMTEDASFKKLELQPVNGIKDMMVILDVRAKNLKELSSKLRILFLKLKVKEVDYNNNIVSPEKFSF